MITPEEIAARVAGMEQAVVRAHLAHFLTRLEQTRFGTVTLTVVIQDGRPVRFRHPGEQEFKGQEEPA